MPSFTADAELELAFDVELLQRVQGLTIPAGLHLRPLASTDYSRGHLTLLATLTVTPDIGQEHWTRRFQECTQLRGTYFPLVLVDQQTDALVATGNLLVERKFIRSAGLAGHIEDIAIAAQWQGKGLGKLLILALSALSDQLGCYKTILDCDPKNEGQFAASFSVERSNR